MKSEIDLLWSPLWKKVSFTVEYLFTKPIAGISFALTAAFAVELSTAQWTMIVLLVLFGVDYLTGLIASRFNKEPITSDRMKKSVGKFILYSVMLLLAFVFESAFFIGEFSFKNIGRPLTLTTLAALFCCLIEAYSIVFENVKAMGFDLEKTIKKIAGKGWGLYDAVKNKKQEE